MKESIELLLCHTIVSHQIRTATPPPAAGSPPPAQPPADIRDQPYEENYSTVSPNNGEASCPASVPPSPPNTHQPSAGPLPTSPPEESATDQSSATGTSHHGDGLLPDPILPTLARILSQPRDTVPPAHPSDSPAHPAAEDTVQPPLPPDYPAHPAPENTVSPPHPSDSPPLSAPEATLPPTHHSNISEHPAPDSSESANTSHNGFPPEWSLPSGNSAEQVPHQEDVEEVHRSPLPSGITNSNNLPPRRFLLPTPVTSPWLPGCAPSYQGHSSGQPHSGYIPPRRRRSKQSRRRRNQSRPNPQSPREELLIDLN